MKFTPRDIIALSMLLPASFCGLAAAEESPPSTPPASIPDYQTKLTTFLVKNETGNSGESAVASEPRAADAQAVIDPAAGFYRLLIDHYSYNLQSDAKSLEAFGVLLRDYPYSVHAKQFIGKLPPAGPVTRLNLRYGHKKSPSPVSRSMQRQPVLLTPRRPSPP